MFGEFTFPGRIFHSDRSTKAVYCATQKRPEDAAFKITKIVFLPASNQAELETATGARTARKRVELAASTCVIGEQPAKKLDAG